MMLGRALDENRFLTDASIKGVEDSKTEAFAVLPCGDLLPSLSGRDCVLTTSLRLQ